MTSGAGGDLAAVEAKLAVDQFVHEAGTVEANIVPVGRLVHGCAVEGSGLAEAAVLAAVAWLGETMEEHRKREEQ